MSKADCANKIFVGVDLHKTQFTVSVITKHCEVLHDGIYGTNDDGYHRFCKLMHQFEEELEITLNLFVFTTTTAKPSLSIKFLKNLAFPVASTASSTAQSSSSSN